MKFHQKAPITLKADIYLMALMFIAPLLNFLSGTSMDLYAPSLPAIAHDFNTSAHMAKSTMVIAIFGFAIGCLIVGMLMDVIGRRTTILSGLLLFLVASLAAPIAQHIDEILILRFLQGFAIASVAIGSRALIADHFQGQRYVIAMIYTSFSYSLGTIVGPFIGSVLQSHFSWQANFIAYACLAAVLLLLYFACIHESLKPEHKTTLKQAFFHQVNLLRHRQLIAGSLIIGFVLCEQLFYPTMGPFIIQQQLHHSVMVYGYGALAIGIGYLMGNLINRFITQHYQTHTRIKFGFIIMFAAIFFQGICAYASQLSTLTLILPMILFNIGLGFIFANVLSIILAPFADRAGTACAVQMFIALVTGSIISYGISLLPVHHLISIVVIFSGLFIVKLGLYYLVCHTHTNHRQFNPVQGNLHNTLRIIKNLLALC